MVEPQQSLTCLLEVQKEKKNNSMDQTAKICQDTKVYSENLKRREAVYSYCMAAI